MNFIDNQIACLNSTFWPLDYYHIIPALLSYVSQQHAAAHTVSSLQLIPYLRDGWIFYLYDSHCFHPSSFCSFCSIFGNTNQICLLYLHQQHSTFSAHASHFFLVFYITSWNGQYIMIYIYMIWYDIQIFVYVLMASVCWMDKPIGCFKYFRKVRNKYQAIAFLNRYSY